MPDALSPSQIHILFGNGEAEKKQNRNKLLHEEPSTSLNLVLFTRRKTVINWRFNIRSNFLNKWKWKIATTTIPDARIAEQLQYFSYSQEHTFQNWA